MERVDGTMKRSRGLLTGTLPAALTASKIITKFEDVLVADPRKVHAKYKRRPNIDIHCYCCTAKHPNNNKLISRQTRCHRT